MPLGADDCDAALQFLTESCDAIAAAKSELERSEILRKRVRKRHFLEADSKLSVAAREALAEVHEDTAKVDNRYIAALTAYEALKAKRELQVILVDVWRTTAASRRQAAK
jgi:hypothetical protein